MAIVTGAGSGIGKASRGRAARRTATPSCSPGAARTPWQQAIAERPATPARARSPCRPTSATRPRCAALFATDEGARSAGSTCCSTTPASARPAVPLEDLTFEQWQTVVDVNLTGVVPVHAGGVQADEGAEPRAAAASSTTARSRPTRRGRTRRPTRRPSTPITGLTKSTALDGRKYDIACGQIDIGNAVTEMAARMTDGRAAGQRHRSRRRAADGRRSTSPTRCSTWRACRSTPTSCS